MKALHCNRDGCNRAEAETCDRTFIEVNLPPVTLPQDSDDDAPCWHELELHFCSTDCLMHWAAAQPVAVQ